MKRDRDIKNNTLFNEIVRIDFFKIENFPALLSNLESMMSNYTFNTADIRNVNINIEDPEVLLTQEMIKSTKTVNYEYISSSGDHKFVLNEYFLIFEKNKFHSYNNIDGYLEILEKILKEILKLEKNIKISRIGIRKKNHLFVNNFKTLETYINSDKFNVPANDSKLLDEFSTIQKNLSKEEYSSNIIMSIKRGRGTTSSIKEEMIMYRFCWDIDCYFRNTEKRETIDQIKKLNAYLFDRYNSIISENLYQLLKSEDLDESTLNELGIYGGINRNE